MFCFLLNMSHIMMQLWCEEIICWAFIMMQLWCWGCSAVPQGQIGFYLHIFSLLYSFCPTLRCNSGNGQFYFLLTSWCNSDVGDVLFPFEYFPHHDATLVLGMFCCASGPDWFPCANPSLFSIPSVLHSDATLEDSIIILHYYHLHMYLV